MKMILHFEGLCVIIIIVQAPSAPKISVDVDSASAYKYDQEDTMNIAEKLDFAIKLHERKTIAGAYVVPYKGGVLHKTTYMMNKEWEAFEEYMKENQFQPTAYAEYIDGDGGELTERYGHPPKMASFGSSSRMI